MRLLVRKRDLNERPDHREFARVQLAAQGDGFGRHKTPVAEFRPGVARVADFIEHLRVADRLARQVEFQHAPRTRGVGDANLV